MSDNNSTGCQTPDWALARINACRRHKETSLDLSGFLQDRKLTCLPDEIGTLTHLTSLNISWNRLTTLPDWLGDLTQLTSLNVSDNPLAELPMGLGNLKQLTSLSICSIHLCKLPGLIKDLKQLEELNASDNELTTIPDWLGSSTSLTSLDLGYNPLTELPCVLGKLTQLTSLALYSIQLRELPDWIKNLKQLEELHVHSNELTTLPDWLMSLTALTLLDLGRNKLTALPESLENLTALETLNVDWNNLTGLTEWQGKLINLTTLSVNHNLLTSLPEWLKNLSNLTTLSLHHNQLTSLPEWLGQLSNLVSLNLYNNKLTALPASVGQLTNLTLLNVSVNPLTALPASLGELPKLTNLHVNHIPLETPPIEIAHQGIEAIREYFRQAQEQGMDTIYEAKLLIVGEPGAGKTTLANKLKDPDFTLIQPLSTTEGINILSWPFTMTEGGDFRTNIWDFGGQQIYHATHQFFLTRRSLYVIVADQRKEDTDFYYWLSIIELLAKDCPVLVVKNERDGRKPALPIGQLRERFTQFKQDFDVDLSVVDSTEFRALLDTVKFQLQQLPHIGSKLPKTWVQVRNKLAEDSRNWIPLHIYLDLCSEHGFTQEKDALQLSQYLHDLGIVVHYQNDGTLRNYVFLNPEWITEAVYQVLDSNSVIKNMGRFTLDDLEDIWNADHFERRYEIVGMMEKFKLCYRSPNEENIYIAPQLLQLDPPEYTWDVTYNLHIQYHYSFMPKGILSRLIVALHEDILDQNCAWRTGVVLERNGAKAEVREYLHEKRIAVRVSGTNRAGLREVIDYELDKIHRSFPGLKYQILVPCNCEECTASTTPHFFPWDELQRFATIGEGKRQCGQSGIMVDARALLNEFVPARENQDMRDIPTNDDRSITYQIDVHNGGHATFTQSGPAINAPGENAQINAPTSQTGDATVNTEQAAQPPTQEKTEPEEKSLPPEFRTFTMIGALVAIIGLMVLAFGMFVGQLEGWTVLLIIGITLFLVLVMPLFDLLREGKLDKDTFANLFGTVLQKYIDLITSGKQKPTIKP